MSKKSKYSPIPFVIISAFAGVLMFVFFKQIIGGADFDSHIQYADTLLGGTGTYSEAYPAPPQAAYYPLFHYFLRIIKIITGLDYPVCVGIIIALTFISSFVLYRILFNSFLKPGKEEVLMRYFIDFISISACFFMGARCGLTDWAYYKYACGPNPFHNPTILFVRPFGIACIIFFARFIEKYNNKEKYAAALIMFGVFSMLAALAKPSFSIVVLPAMGICVLIEMIKRKELKVGLLSMLVVIPTVALCLYQFVFVTSDEVGTAFRFAFGSFMELTPKQVLYATIVTLPVPILILLIRRMKKDTLYLTGYVSLVIGWLEMFMCTDGYSGNFSWGYDISVQISTVIALACGYKALKDNKSTYNKIVFASAFIIFVYQVVTGIMYYTIGYTQKKYWI